MNRYNSVYLFLISIIFSTSVAAQSDTNNIEWNKDRPLLWEDFKGEIDRDSESEATSKIGIMFKEINWENNLGRTKIIAYFSQNISWTKSQTDEYLLKHEQGHFDIAELFARKLRKRLNNRQYKRDTMSKVLEETYSEINEAENNYQDEYDRETEHHKNIQKQKEWEERIAKELEKLSRYSNPEIIIKLR